MFQNIGHSTGTFNSDSFSVDTSKPTLKTNLFLHLSQPQKNDCLAARYIYIDSTLNLHLLDTSSKGVRERVLILVSSHQYYEGTNYFFRDMQDSLSCLSYFLIHQKVKGNVYSYYLLSHTAGLSMPSFVDITLVKVACCTNKDHKPNHCCSSFQGMVDSAKKYNCVF
jgi:hypothetical protein